MDSSIQRKKVVIITGAANDIGKSIAIEFANNSYNVMLNDINLKRLEKTAEDVSDSLYNKDSTNIKYYCADISQEQECTAFIQQTMNEFGRIDVLVNNSIIMQPIPGNNANSLQSASDGEKQITPYFTLEEYQITDSNLKGISLCIREAVQQMVIKNENRENRQKRINSIINISASYNSIPKPQEDSYTFSLSGVDPHTASKEGIRTLTKTLALQLADMGIRINAIAPGIIYDNIKNTNEVTDKGMLIEMEKEIPLHRVGKSEDIAKIALYLASDDASSITGTMIYADGGLSLLHSNYLLEQDLIHD